MVVEFADLGSGLCWNLVRCDMRHDEVATGRHGGFQLFHYFVGLVNVADEMEDGDEQDGDRLIEVYEGLQGRMGDNLGGISQVTVNCDDKGVLDEKGLRVRYDDGIVIDV